MSRKAKPIELLLKLKQIKPDLEFVGADAKTYNEFLDEQAEANLLATIKEQKEEKKPKKKSTKKVKKVKQTIDPETVETGEVQPENETVNEVAEE